MEQSVQLGDSMLSSKRIGFVGSGAMGEAIIKGLLARGIVVPSNLIASDPVPTRREQMSTDYGVDTTDDNTVAVRDADIVVLCVKPQVAGAVYSCARTRGPGQTRCRA